MIERLKKPVKPLWYVAAFTIIFTAIFIQAARFAIPYISQYQPTLEKLAGQQLNAKVKIGELKGSWYGLRPKILLKDFYVQDKNDRDMFSIRDAKFELDILASIFHRTLVWQTIEIERLNVTVQQSKAGAWSVLGLASEKKSDASWGLRYRDPGSLFLMAKRVNIQAADIYFQFHNNRQFSTAIPGISIQNDGQFHRLNALVDIDGERVLDFVMEGVGDPGSPEEFFATAYLQMDQFPLEKLVDLFSEASNLKKNQKSLALESSNMDLKLWFDFSSPTRIVLTKFKSMFGVDMRYSAKP